MANEDIILSKIAELSDRVEGKITELSDRVEGKITELSDRVEGKITELSDKFDQRFDGVDQRFDGVDQRFENIEGRLDLLAEHAVKVDEKLEKLEHLPGEFAEFKERITITLDSHTKMLKRLDDDRLLTINRLDRVERRVGLNQ